MRPTTLQAVAVQLLGLALASVLFFAPGCGREEITHHRVKKASGAVDGARCRTADGSPAAACGTLR
jgi:hypothetical protein